MRWLVAALCLVLLFSLPYPAQASPPWLGRFTSLVTRFIKKPEPVIKVPRDSFPISKKDLFWGRLQVDRMMKDRPAMAQLVRKGDVIYEYAARQFAGASNHRRIIWDSTPPPGKYFADNGRRNGVSRIRVQIHTHLGHKLGSR